MKVINCNNFDFVGLSYDGWLEFQSKPQCGDIERVLVKRAKLSYDKNHSIVIDITSSNPLAVAKQIERIKSYAFSYWMGKNKMDYTQA